MICSPQNNITVRVIVGYTMVQAVLGVIITSFLISDQIAFTEGILGAVKQTATDFTQFIQSVNYAGLVETGSLSALHGWTITYLIFDLFWVLSILLLFLATCNCLSDLMSCYCLLVWIVMTIVICLLDAISSIYFLVKWNEVNETVKLSELSFLQAIIIIFHPLFCSKAVIFWIINVACVVLMIYRFRKDFAFARNKDLEKYDAQELDQRPDNRYPSPNDRFDGRGRGYDNEGFSRNEEQDRYHPHRNQAPPKFFGDPPIPRQFNGRSNSISDDAELPKEIGRSNFILKPTERPPIRNNMDNTRQNRERYPMQPRQEDNYSYPPPDNYFLTPANQKFPRENYGPAKKIMSETPLRKPFPPQQPLPLTPQNSTPKPESPMGKLPNGNWADIADDRYIPIKKKNFYEDVQPIRQMAQAYEEYKHRRESVGQDRKPRLPSTRDNDEMWEDVRRTPPTKQYGVAPQRQSRLSPRIVEEPNVDYNEQPINRPLRQREPIQPRQYLNDEPAKPMNSRYGIPRVQLSNL